jgi:phosphate transport system substrate-binding protein
VFDKRRDTYLNSFYFGVLGTRRWAPGRMLCVLALLATGVAGCSSKRAPGSVEDSLTSGRISVVSAPEILPIIMREQAAFDSLYPAANITVVEGTSREAVRSLFGGESDLAIISRELEPEERGAAVRGRLELEGYRFATDGVALVVHPANAVENLTLADAQGIYGGRIARWGALGGADAAIEPVIQAPESDLMAFFEQRVMNGEPIRASVVYQLSDSGVVAYVRTHPAAIGFVSMAWADRGARALRLASLKGLAYRRPDAEAVYRGDYPLTRTMSLYVRPRGPSLANGFITFVTSRDGQAIVRDGGLVPTAVPVRFIRRSPMRGSHGTGP